ncbi:MAG: biotin synthase BioB [Planctomycetes bacterium]|jgi:biotin synthase|nr:biotin synthase BioB [Planctomycetota bacterium]
MTTHVSNPSFYAKLTADALADRPLSESAALALLNDPAVELLPLLNSAYAVRRARFGRAVQVHILNNAQNGRCPEDCAYCTQARTSEADITDYPVKSEEEVLAEAKRAYEAGAHRYCMVFAGRGPNEQRTAVLADLVRKIKQRYPLEVCVSAGLLDDTKARALAEAGLDRYNHNLNTSRANYPNICTTHTYDDRVNTLRSARQAGVATCSGLIAGMGEPPEDLVEIAFTLRELGSESIPVNFLLPFEGNVLDTPGKELTPGYCLRVLCLFRLTNPRAEVRCAAGREFHLRSMEVMCLYPANSLFLDGYLNGRGAERRRTYQMIRDAGFEIQSEHPLDELLGEIGADVNPTQRAQVTVDGGRPTMKTEAELRPARA